MIFKSWTGLTVDFSCKVGKWVVFDFELKHM